jgi:hypothetical protein
MIDGKVWYLGIRFKSTDDPEVEM